ncbi:MAG: hypothetical protein ACON4R_13940 [Akkermansiaceae bacterium]
MFSASDLSEDQVEAVRGWVAQGARMADVQKKLTEEFGFKVTYMDTRFLALDLELEFAKDEEEKTEDPAASVLVEDPAMPEFPAGIGEVDATVDQVARPGAMVSGTVTFSDGMKGRWLIDEMGRPSIDPDQAGYQPTEDDLEAFQEKLRGLLDGHL